MALTLFERYELAERCKRCVPPFRLRHPILMSPNTVMEETDDEDEDEDDGDEDEDHGEGDEQDYAGQSSRTTVRVATAHAEFPCTEEEIDDDEDYYDANADIADAETLQMLSDLAHRSEEDEERDAAEHGHYPTSWDENDNVWISFGEAIQGQCALEFRGVPHCQPQSVSRRLGGSRPRVCSCCLR